MGSVFGDAQDIRFNNRDHSSPLYVKDPMGLGSFDGTGHICDRLIPNYRNKFIKKSVAPKIPQQSDSDVDPNASQNKLKNETSAQSIFAPTSLK